jgi:signal transduction histidine kinase
MKESKSSTANLLFTGFIIILAGLSLFSYQRSLHQAEAADLVSHTYKVKLKLEETFNLVTNAETSQRGYLLTKEPKFLEHFSNARKQIYSTLAELEKLVADNPQQVTNLQDLNLICKKRIEWLEIVVDTFQHTPKKYQDSLILNGQEITISLRNTISQMKTIEDALLKQRMVDKQNDERATATTILLFSITSIFLLALVFFRLKKQTNISKVLERKVYERTLEIKHANDILEQKNIELQHRNEELNSFTFIASHDLKEPLRKIELYLDRMNENYEPNLSAKGRDYLSKLGQTTVRMQELLNAIFTYAQTDEKEIFEETDLNEIAALSVNTLQEVINDKQAIIEYNNLPIIEAIPFQMEQLFTNLIGNALKYSKAEEKPHIMIRAADTVDEKGDRYCDLSFTDNGIGFDNAYKEKVFEVFQRLHSRNQYSGTGIGLAICKKIAANHGGYITANSSPGVGSVFTISIRSKNYLKPQHEEHAVTPQDLSS